MSLPFLMEIAVVVCGTLAVRLLLIRPRRSVPEIRLAALAPRAPEQRGRREVRRRPPTAVGRVVLVCLSVAVAAAVAGPLAGAVAGAVVGGVLWWRRARGGRAASVDQRSRVLAGLPIAVDLLVAGLRAGGTMPEVLGAVTEAVGGPLGGSLGEVGERLRLGADPAAAWNGIDGPPELAAVGRALARAADTGAPIADVLDRHAAELRASARNRALAQSQRLAVLVVAPLGLCFLPAFVLIGVVPMAAGLISGLALP